MIGRQGKGRAADARQALGDVPAQLAALHQMTVAELREKWLALYGEPSASRNKDHLRKRLAWRVQELAEGGLSQRARDRIEEILAGHRLPDIARKGRAAAALLAGTPPAAPTGPARDPRLPSPGTEMRKVHRGVEHLVTVLEDGFEHQGQRYGALSAVAKAITGTTWNGYLFFGLMDRRGGTHGGQR